MIYFNPKIVQYNITKYVCSTDFALKMVKQENILNAVDLYVI